MEVCLKAAIAQKKADMTFVSGDQVQDVTDMLERVFDNLPEPAHNQSNNSHDHAAEDPFTGPRSHQQSKLSSLQLTGLFRNEASLETPSCESGDASSIFYLLIEEATSLPKVAGKMPHPCMVVRSLGQEARTRPLAETTFPLWNQILPVRVREIPCVMRAEVFHIPDADLPEEQQNLAEVKPPVFLGYVEVVATEEHVDGFTDEWFKLVSDAGVSQGKVRIACSFEMESLEALQRGLVPSARRFRRLAQETWMLVEKDIDNLGVKFFMQIFEICPDILQLFSFKDATSLEDSPGMKNHANTVLRTVGRAVAGLNDLESLMPVLHGLGTRHARYGLKPMYLDILGQALLWTLEEALGRMWTPDVAMAWSKTFAMVQSGIMPGLLQACAEMEKDQETHQSIQQRADTSA